MNYLFIANGSVPTKAEYYSQEPLTLNSYSIPCIEAALKMCDCVYLGINRKYADRIKCVNYPCVHFYNATIYRNPLAIRQIYKAYKNLNLFLKHHNVSVLHCNTPIGGFLGRICGKKGGVKVIIYTAHGFHFYKGGNKLLNFIFYSTEKILSKWTDAIITINEEDYNAAKRMTKYNHFTKVYKINGVGIDLMNIKLQANNPVQIRNSYKLSKKDYMIITVGDINKNKNQEVIIEALHLLNNDHFHFFICGEGPRRKYLEDLAQKYSLCKQVHFLGYRTDVIQLLSASDVFVLPSLREGLPRSIMEAMAVGLPCVVSDIRGNIDLIDKDRGGVRCSPKCSWEFADALLCLYNSSEMRSRYGKYNLEKIKSYNINEVKKQVENIYKETILQ